MNQFHGEFSEEEALAKALAASMAENVKNSTQETQIENRRRPNSRKSLDKENNNNTQIKCLAPKCSKMFRADVMPR